MELAPALVTRSIELPVSADEAWASLRDADGLAGWLGDAVDLDVVPGAAGTVTEGDVVRRIVVTEVVEGRSVGVVWWDEAAPEEASVVTIAVTPGGDDAATVTVTEQLAGSATASIGAASISDLVAAGDVWDRRLRALVGASTLADACV
ncbi:MAG: SRPBCC family protein [Aquihabitans sp.]